jgi:hypothetical protein
MDLQYWLAYQSDQVAFFLYHLGWLLIAILYYGVSLWYYRRKTLSKFEKWLDFRPETIAKHKLGHLMFSIAPLVIFSILSAFLFVSVVALQIDINRDLPCEQRTGVVTSEFALFRGRSYAVIDGTLHTYVNSLPNTPLHEGAQYQITHLQNSREIIRADKLPD